MKSFQFNPITLSVYLLLTASLTACGGGSSDTSTHPTSFTSNTTSTLTCVNGIPKNLNTQGTGIFNEEWFSLEEGNYDEEQPVVLYSNKIIDGILYQNTTNLIKNASINSDIDDLDNYVLTPNTFTTAFQYKKTSSGFPLGYAISQSEQTLQINRFNDTCSIHSEQQVNQHFKKIDISGKTVSDLFKYYEYPQTAPAERYISSGVVYTLENANKDALKKLLNDQTKFPAGSTLSYIDQQTSTAPEIFFSKSDQTDFRSLEEFKKATVIPKGYQWKDDIFSNHKVTYLVNATTGQRTTLTDAYAGVQLDGKIYQAYLIAEGNLAQDLKQLPDESMDMSETFFNKTAVQTIADALNRVL
ncbi:hypothetical protein [Acinetobacter sp. 1000160]|uniref:hypothetical protein n=1 Tax=Acinetobacter sp. 1000160 TaxID=1310800 RepID=UPI0004467596|nr:hypothetical protein [Acinetobacter sp. 1000160]EXB45509.1 putative lipoprotein [Acinetobacter baumannii 146457]EYT14892.1 putative lipoprotein [Acinetobacter sp. 1000160]